MPLRSFRWLMIAAAALAGSLGLLAQAPRVQGLGVGRLLVATRHAPDPVFGETVILLVRYGQDGTVGLVINRPTDVPISRALERLNGAKQRTEPVFAGGPVETGSVLALLRASTMPTEDAIHVFGKVYLISSKLLLEKSLASKAGTADHLRVYLGYCGWSKGQLEDEVSQGAWHVLPSDADQAFDAEPETLWSRLIIRGEQRIARALFPALSPSR
jgi:putative transcriptional regulator